MKSVEDIRARGEEITHTLTHAHMHMHTHRQAHTHAQAHTVPYCHTNSHISYHLPLSSTQLR
jgi:hypothetical protein